MTVRKRIRNGGIAVAGLMFLAATIPFVVTHLGYRVPEYAPAPTNVSEIGEVEIDACKLLSLFQEPSDWSASPGIGRSYRQLTASELAKAQPTRLSAPVRNKAKRALFFDLWDAAAGLQNSATNCGLRLHFTLRSEISRDVFLALCGNDNILVYLNGKAIFGSTGGRECRLLNNIVALPLLAGSNSVELFCQKVDNWYAIPAVHTQPEWAVSLQVYWTEDAAWSACKIQNYHPFDVPIVKTIDDLAVDVHFLSHREVSLHTIDGKVLAAGTAQEDGSISWKSRPDGSRPPTLAIGSFDNEYGEVIALTGDRDVDELVRNVVASAGGDDENPWKKRAIHLVEPQFRSQRNVWWARKVCLSLAKLAGNDRPAAEDVINICPAAAIEFGRYSSRLDGTTQYFMYSKPRTGARIDRIVAIAPTVPSPVRPFLESWGVSDLPQTEMLTSLAFANGVSALWVGGSCVDYGGYLSRLDINECVDAFRRHCGITSAQIYIEGTCSAGVGALGAFASGTKANGIVLWSPVINRRTHRWLPDMGLQNLEYPSLCLAEEQVNDRLGQYTKVPLFMVFDHDSPGHGDREAVAKFMDEIEAHKGRGTSVWIEPPEPELPWGLRLYATARIWMQWIKSCPVSQPTLDGAESPRIPKTVKTALLEGFYISKQDRENPTNASWIQFWRELLKRYRGEYPNLDRASAPTEIHFTDIDTATLDAIDAGTWGGDKSLLGVAATGSALKNESVIWGFRLVTKTGKAKVEIIHTLGSPEMFPKVDILVDGCCSGAVWRRTGGEWSLVQVWR